MTRLLDSFNQLFARPHPIPEGIYHFIAPPDDPRNYRLHLRVEKDGNGILIVNASTVLHLNQTATEYAYYYIQGEPETEVIKKIASRYRVEHSQAEQDYRDLVERIDILVTTPDLDPITFLDFDRQAPYSAKTSAPYRLDCALTYRLPSVDDRAAAPGDRVKRELTTQEWQGVFDKAWKAGIPHLIFTGGEPTLRDDLVDLIAHAEANGQVTGLLTDGLRLVEATYLEKLSLTGLDHIMIILQPEQESSWNALQNACRSDVFTAAHLTLTEENASRMREHLERAAAVGVNAISLSASTERVNRDLQAARDLAAQLNLQLVWDLPVPYSASNPVALEVEAVEAAAGVGRGWLYVEPDGDVLPAQGVPRVLGNLLTDAWETIWENAQR